MASERLDRVPGGSLSGILLVGVLFLALTWAPADGSAQESPGVPSPEAHFGYEPGTDRRLTSWSELTSYYEALAESSPRVRVDTLGLTTRARPMVMLTITSVENQARLEDLRGIQDRLSDPRSLRGADETERLLADGRAVVLMTHGIHPAEVGSTEVAPRIAHYLASSDDEAVAEILDNVIVLDIPSLNPDGTDWVVEWYERWLGTEYEGAPYPGLYHYYIGHDANRDWTAFTQVETTLAVQGAHNRWRPHIVHDFHQMGPSGPRIFVPPYLEPWEPNVDPALVGAVNDLGTSVAARLHREQRTGVVVAAIYDAFSPTRAYPHYHAGARILSEVASARMATPDTTYSWQLRPDRGFDPDRSTWNHPAPWAGGRWGLPEITEYMESSALAVLQHAARNRRQWLETALGINRRASDGWDSWPDAWILPDPADEGVPHLLRVLRLGDVEVFRTREPVELPGRTAPVGSFVVLMDQPYAGFAQALLEPRSYPDLREYPGGPPLPPYDGTAHTLPLLMGVEAVSLERAPSVEMEPFPEVPRPDFTPPSPLGFGGGTRVGLYAPHQESMETGWTRWLFDRHGISYDALSNEEIVGGGLEARYDVILLQNQSYGSIVSGWAERIVPPAWAGGLGDAGTRAIRDFVRNGGRLVAVEAATDFAIRALDLGVSNAVERLPDQEFFAPGSIVRIVDEGAAFGEGRESERAAWYGVDSRAFTVTDPSIRVRSRYGEIDPLLSGWLLGPEHLEGRPAILEADVGRGSVVLFGFQPNHRGQSVATWPLLFDTLVWRSVSDGTAP